jgi:glycosyltransferase involved in cell wall biosynthesis
MDVRRAMTRLQVEVRAGRPVPAVELDRKTRSWDGTAPRVSVIVPLYNYEDHVGDALASVAQGRYRDVELVIVDDGSSDGSLAASRRFLAEHEGLPALIVRHPVNRGLGPARNAGIAFARGELAFMLDADNVVYRHALERLVETLDADLEAVAAYGMLGVHSDTGPDGLLSYQPWRPERLRTGNYIDAMALWRIDGLRRLGGYAVDRRLHGWEDYDLWCRAADAGYRAAFVPEVVARYRRTRHSMLSVTNLSAQTAVSLLCERAPRLFEGVEPPL